MHALTLLPATLTLLTSLTSASPTPPAPPPRDTCYPPNSASRGFRLFVNVTDRTKDLKPPVHGTFLNLAHIGPAQNRAVAMASTAAAPPPVFYQNGTYADFTLQQVTILTDGGTLPFPEGLTYQTEPDDSNGQGLYAFGGSGSGGVRLTRLWEPVSYLTILADVVQSTLAVCTSTIPYYGDKKLFNVVNWVQATRDSTGTHVVVPKGCVAVKLVPQCAALGELPEGALSSHEFAQEVRCYDDVAGVKWGRYSS